MPGILTRLGLLPERAEAPGCAIVAAHPDDETIGAAVRVLAREASPVPWLLEFTSYHEHCGRMIAGDFLPHDGCKVQTVVLSPLQRELKREAFSRCLTQQRVLQYFPVDVEKFRRAP